MERKLVQPDTKLIQAVIANGGDPKKCYQCATCASVCALSKEGYAFPRRPMLMAQWGLKEDLLQDPGPWLCFYCGECSKACPRQANPGESMMAMRRYLTTVYDWTGLSKLMYSSDIWEVGILAAVALFVVMLFTLPQNFGFGLLNHSTELARSNVMLDKFAPAEMVHHGDQILGALLSFFLLTNAARMFLGLTRGQKIPLSVYISQLPFILFQAATQVRWKSCGDGEGVKNWLRHLFLVSGYVLMFGMIALALPWFQVNDSSFHLSSILGYYCTAVLLITTGWIVADRARKACEMHRFSHLSDWMFPMLLFLTAATGILVNILRLSNQAMPTYYMYTVHMAIAVPMLVVEVPFGKWAHLLYRPIAIYVAAVREKASESSGQQYLAACQAPECHDEPVAEAAVSATAGNESSESK
jgi:ferredoxin